MEADKTMNSFEKKRGLLISLEGIDGSGKSLQARALKKNLQNMNYPVVLVRDPGGPPVSEKIRKVLLDKKNRTITPMTELLLYCAARSQLVTEYIAPALKEGKIVITDRFIDSTISYQGYGRSIPISYIVETNRLVCGNILPDRTYVLDISWDESIRRMGKITIKKDRMENQMKHFFDKVRKGYLTIAKQEPERILLLNGEKSINELEKEIFKDALMFIKKFNI